MARVTCPQRRVPPPHPPRQLVFGFDECDIDVNNFVVPGIVELAGVYYFCLKTRHQAGSLPIPEVSVPIGLYVGAGR